MKPVKGYEGLYSAHEEGYIWSHRQNKRLKVFLVGHGYECLVLNSGKSPKKFLVHRLVAQTFIPNPLNLREVNHKDTNRRNNAHGNLEWVTSKQNKQHAINLGLYKKLIGEGHYNSKLTVNKVKEIRRLFTEGVLSNTEIARRYRVSGSTIGGIVKGRDWKQVI